VPRDTAARAPATRPAGRRPPRLLAAGLGAAALVALVAVGAAVLLRGGPATAPTPSLSAAAVASPSAAPTASALPTASPTLGPFPNEVEAAILAALPSALAKTCVRGGTVADATLAGFTPGSGRVPLSPRGSYGGVTCHPASGAKRLYVMTPWNEMSRSGANADEFLGWLAGQHRIPDGRCAIDARAHERWVTTRGSGLLACMNPYEGRPWIYFTFGNGQYLAFATRDDSDYDALYAWWDQLKTFLP
jgi:hypothetical protein